MKMNRNARITLIMTTAVCLAILATAAIINTIHGNENQALVIQCIIFAVYNIALNFALNNIRIVKQNAARKSSMMFLLLNREPYNKYVLTYCYRVTVVYSVTA